MPQIGQQSGKESEHQKEDCDADIILDNFPFAQPVKAYATVVLKPMQNVKCLGNPFLLIKRIQVTILLEVS